MAQGDKKQEPVWTFRASRAVMAQAKVAAEALGISRSEFIRRAIADEARRAGVREA